METSIYYPSKIFAGLSVILGNVCERIYHVCPVICLSIPKPAASKMKVPPAKQADTEAAELLDTYGNNILRLAYSYLHNYSDAEDILQDTPIQFLKTRPVLKDSEHKKAWLLHVAANLSKNRIVYNRTRHTDELNDTLVSEEREDLSFVWEAVKALPETYREAIHLFYYEGYQTAEIAKILDRKEATIRSDLRRGRQKLKEILKEDYDFA